MMRLNESVHFGILQKIQYNKKFWLGKAGGGSLALSKLMNSFKKYLRVITFEN